MIERLTGRYEIDAASGCWNWTGGTSMGYGTITCRGLFAAPIRTHRYSYIAHKGKIPKGLHVLHRCDNKLCVNPNHLYVGTNKRNREDTHGKHKSYRDNGKFDKSDIDAIRARFAAGDNDREIAATFGCSYQAINHIRTGKNWGWYKC